MEGYLIFYHGDKGQNRQACLVSIQHVLGSRLSLSEWACVGRHRDKFTKVCSLGLKPSVETFLSGLNWIKTQLGHTLEGRKGEWKNGTCVEKNVIMPFVCISSPFQLPSNERMGLSW